MRLETMYASYKSSAKVFIAIWWILIVHYEKCYGTEWHKMEYNCKLKQKWCMVLQFFFRKSEKCINIQLPQVKTLIHVLLLLQLKVFKEFVSTSFAHLENDFFPQIFLS